MSVHVPNLVNWFESREASRTELSSFDLKQWESNPNRWMIPLQEEHPLTPDLGAPEYHNHAIPSVRWAVAEMMPFLDLTTLSHEFMFYLERLHSVRSKDNQLMSFKAVLDENGNLEWRETGIQRGTDVMVYLGGAMLRRQVCMKMSDLFVTVAEFLKANSLLQRNDQIAVLQVVEAIRQYAVANR